MFNVSALLLDDASKRATPLTNSAINQPNAAAVCSTQGRSPASAG